MCITTVSSCLLLQGWQTKVYRFPPRRNSTRTTIINSHEKRKLKPAPLQPHPGQTSLLMPINKRTSRITETDAALTSWRRCLRSLLCRSALWGFVWESDQEGPGWDPRDYTPPPRGPRSIWLNTHSIWRSMHTWWLICAIVFHSFIYFIFEQFFYLIYPAFKSCGVKESICFCAWFRLPDMLVRADRGILLVTWEICVCTSASCCLMPRIAYKDKKTFLQLIS